MGSGGGGTATGGAEDLTCWGATADWTFGFGFEPHEVVRKTATNAMGHHVRIVMLGAPLKDFPDLRERELQAGGPEEVAPSATLPVGLVPAFAASAASVAAGSSGWARFASTVD